MDVLLAGTTVMVSEPLAVPDVLNPSTQTVCDVLVMEVGVADPSVATPPEMDNAKSATFKSPVPPVVSYTLSLKVTVSAVLSELIVVLDMVGADASAVTTIETLSEREELLLPVTVRLKAKV